MERYRPGEDLRITEQGVEAAVLKLIEEVKNHPELEFMFNIRGELPQARPYLVGGIVRDALMGLPSSDFDFVVSGVTPEEMVKYLNSNGEIKVESDIDTAVYRFIPDEAPAGAEMIDIALPRSEIYENGSRKPQVQTEGVTIEEDLSRRDFTINAFALEIGGNVSPREAFLDPFGGKRDINNRLIRGVGEPRERFMEDPLRMLRAVRFATRYEFDIEDETFAAICDLRHEILKDYKTEEGEVKQRVSNERIAKELVGAFSAHPTKSLELYDKTGLLGEILPEIEDLKGIGQGEKYHNEGDVYTHTKMVLEKLPLNSAPELILAALFHDLGKPSTRSEENGEVHFYDHEDVSVQIAYKILTRYHFKRDFIEKVAWLVENHMRMISFPKMRRSKQMELVSQRGFQDLLFLASADVASSLGPDGSADMDIIDQATEIARELEVSPKLENGAMKPIVNGHDLIDIAKGLDSSFDPKIDGRKIGETLKIVNDRYFDGDIEDKDEALKMSRTILMGLTGSVITEN